MVVGEAAIAVQLVEAGEQPLDVVERVRPVRDAARRARAATASGSRRSRRGSRRPARRSAVDRPLALRRPRQHAERLDFLQQDADRFFEFQRCQPWQCGQASMPSHQSSQAPPFRRRKAARLRDESSPTAARAARRRRGRATARGWPLTSSSSDTRRSPRCREKQLGQRLERRRVRAAAPPGGSRPRCVVRSLSAAIGSSSVATIRADSSSFSNLPRTSSIASLSMSEAVLAEGLGEDHDFDAAGDVVQHEDRHAVALLASSAAAGRRRCRRPRRRPPTRSSSATRCAPNVFSSSAKRSSGWPLM